MGRKKLNPEEKKSNFGITLDPEILNILEKEAESEGLTKSELIEKSLKLNINKCKSEK